MPGCAGRIAGSGTLVRGGGLFRFEGTGEGSAFATVFRDTLCPWVNAHPAPTDPTDAPGGSAHRPTHSACTPTDS